VVPGLEVRAYTLSHSASPIFVKVFWDRVLQTVCWLQTAILLISAFWAASITDVSHRCPTDRFFLWEIQAVSVGNETILKVPYWWNLLKLIFFNFSIVLDGGTLCLQKFLQYIKYIILEFTPCHHSPLSPICLYPPTPGIVSPGIIFPFTCMYTQDLHQIHPPTPFTDLPQVTIGFMPICDVKEL
jgi:hypothetical protein